MKTKTLLTCGVIAGPLFVITLLLEGVTRANYSPWRHPGSSLALGDFGWVQDLNFLIGGLLTLAFAIGLWRLLRSTKGSRLGILLIGWWAIGLIGAGIFVTDPVNGFPPGTPNQVLQPTLHGSLHDLFSVPGFIALIAACFVFSHWFAKRGERRWAIYSALSGVVFAVAFALANLAFSQVSGLVNFGGLFNRIAAIAGWSWLTMLAIYFLRVSSKAWRKPSAS
jgi:hypothetical protein